MSTSERQLAEMRMMNNTAPGVPVYNPMTQVPPDLLARMVGQGTTSQSTVAYAEQAGTINNRAQPEYFRALRRQGYFITQPFTATTDPQIIRPLESRTYFFIQNLSTSADLYIGFGTIPSGIYGLTLVPGAAYEPFTVPTNEIYIAAQSGTVTGYIIYARETE